MAGFVSYWRGQLGGASRRFSLPMRHTEPVLPLHNSFSGYFSTPHSERLIFEEDKLKINRILVIALLTIIITSCGALPAKTSNPTASHRPKQPEPNQPRVYGEIFGVIGDTLIIIHVQTLMGWEARTITRQGNGIWESIITDASGIEYIITAEANGYASVPISYTIHLDGNKAYLVENGQITSKEAEHLDFHFDPIPTTAIIE